MKKIYALLTICCTLIACKKIDVNFIYAPDAPRAGEKVQFTNQSSSGENWEWTFGDGSTSTLKSPSHTYKRPGTYRVILKVDKKNSLTATKELTVYDTVPTFTCTDTTFYIFKDYTFTACVYNPYNYDVKYEWYKPENPEGLQSPYMAVTDTTWKASTLHLYFTRPMTKAPLLGLRVILDDDTTYIEKEFEVLNRTTNSIALLTSDEGYYRQRIFGDRAERAKEDMSAAVQLEIEQDTAQTYNGYLFTLSELSAVFPGLQGFHIANRKIYYRMDGLWVANIDGAYPVEIDERSCLAMTLDTKDNRIYWANDEGVWYMPFVGSDNNKFVSTPVLLNTMTNVIKLAADGEPK